MAFVWNYIKIYPRDLFFTILGALAFTAVMLGLPSLVAGLINDGIIGGDRSVIGPYALKMLVLVGACFAIQVYARFAMSRLTSRALQEIRDESYAKMVSLSHHEFQELGVPSLTNRISSDAFILLQFMQMILTMGMSAPIMVISSVLMVARTSATMGLQVLPSVILVGVMVFFLARLTVPISNRQQKTLDEINRTQRENITGLRVVRAFNREGYQEDKFARVNQDYRKLSTKLFTILGLSAPLAWIFIDLALCLVVWVGAGGVESGDLLLGDLVAFVQYVKEAIFSVLVFSSIFMMYPRAQVSVARLKEVLETPISVKNPDDPLMETDGSGTLEFREVSFMYPDANEPVLHDISFKTKAGETVAFIGSTGSGKSTVAKLIPRFYDVTSGEILLDGVNIQDLDLRVLRDKIGFTPQEARLFTGQISDNLRFGYEEADWDDMDHATRVAQAREFISKTKKGLKTVLSEGGSNLSGGQKQRLSIARSVIGDHEVYIFDDSFSALDYKTDAAVREALALETQDGTSVIVAQRVGTIMDADQIIVLDRGRIAASGTHQELLESSELYYEIASSQLSKEELGA